MANELQYSIAFEFQKLNSKPMAESFLAMMETIAGNIQTHLTVSVGITEEVMALGDVTAASAFCVIFNEDDTNYVEWRTGTGAGNDAIKIPPKRPVCFFMGSDITAPYLIANTAACKVSYWLIPD